MSGVAAENTRLPNTRIGGEPAPIGEQYGVSERLNDGKHHVLDKMHKYLIYQLKMIPLGNVFEKAQILQLKNLHWTEFLLIFLKIF